MSGGGAKDVTTTNAPPVYAQPYLERLAKEASALQQSGGLSNVADFTAPQIQAQQGVLNYAQDPGTQAFLQNMQGANQNLLNAPDIANNPYLPAYLQQQSDLLTRGFTETLNPAITGEAVLSGGVGGSRQGVAQGLAAGRTQEAIQRGSSDILNSAYAQGLSAQAKGLALAPSTLQAPLQIQGAIGAVGDVQQAMNQLRLDSPGLGLERLGQLLGLSTGTAGVSTGPGAKSNKAMSAIGGAAAGASIATGISTGSSAGPWGAAIGGLIGLMAS